MSKLGKVLSLMFVLPAYKAHKAQLRYDARYRGAVNKALLNAPLP